MLTPTRKTSTRSIFLDNFDYEDCIHEQKITDRFGRQKILNQKQFLSDRESIFICFTNRCGSNFLADVLAKNGFFAQAGEFFNWSTIINTSDRRKISSLDDYCIYLVKRHAIDNSFISKIGCEQLLMLSKLGQIPNIFNNPKFIWIRRRDIVGQAISLLIASQTKKWTSEQAGEAVSPQYNKNSIQKIIRNINLANLQFATYFSLFDADFLEIVYEDFCNDVDAHIKNICNFTGRECPIDGCDRGSLTIQRNSINDNFREQFLLDMRQEFDLNIKNRSN